MKLNDLGKKYDTDKCSTGHNYLDTYEKFLPYTGLYKILEIGVFKGGSLRMWRDYYPSAEVVGIDIDPSCMFEEERIKTVLMDTKDIDSFDVQDFDLVVEDGSHKWADQMRIFLSVFPRLRSGSYYILEDLHSSRHLDYKNLDISPLDVFKMLPIFFMIDKFELYDQPGNQGLGSISLLLRKK
jgi:hypothetical protein